MALTVSLGGRGVEKYSVKCDSVIFQWVFGIFSIFPEISRNFSTSLNMRVMTEYFRHIPSTIFVKCNRGHEPLILYYVYARMCTFSRAQ